MRQTPWGVYSAVSVVLMVYSGVTAPCRLRSRRSQHCRMRAKSDFRGDSLVGDILRRLRRCVSVAGCLSYLRGYDVVYGVYFVMYLPRCTGVSLVESLSFRRSLFSD